MALGLTAALFFIDSKIKNFVFGVALPKILLEIILVKEKILTCCTFRQHQFLKQESSFIIELCIFPKNHISY